MNDAEQLVVSVTVAACVVYLWWVGHGLWLFLPALVLVAFFHWL
jgi:hypothetical protein